jgi:hypothetical protein
MEFVPVHSADCVKICSVACRRVRSSALLYPIGTRPDVDSGNETYKLNHKD